MGHDVTGYPDDDDGNVLADIAAQGVDMSQPLDIEFPVSASDEAAALAIEKALAKAGYETSVEYDEGELDEDGEVDPDDEDFGPMWTVYAKVVMIPEYAEIIRIQADLDRLAAPFDGCCDGWGVMLDGDPDEDEI
jgi:hypothetical protein